MPEDGAITAKPAPSFRANLRTGLTYVAFVAGHIWAAFSVLVLVGVTHSASLDWPLAIENGWAGQLIFSGLLIAVAAAHAALVIWLLYKGWRAWWRGGLTFPIAVWPLATLAALLIAAMMIFLQIQYWDWQQLRRGTTGSIIYRCQQLDENFDFQPTGLSFKYVRKGKWIDGDWYIKVPDDRYRSMVQVDWVATNFRHGGPSFQWIEGDGRVMVASMSDGSTTGFGWEMETVNIGPAATAPRYKGEDVDPEFVNAWVEQEFYCDAEIGSWRPD